MDIFKAFLRLYIDSHAKCGLSLLTQLSNTPNSVPRWRCVAVLLDWTGRMVIIYIYYLQSTAWENIYNDLFSQQRGTVRAGLRTAPVTDREEAKMSSVQCPACPNHGGHTTDLLRKS